MFTRIFYFSGIVLYGAYSSTMIALIVFIYLNTMDSWHGGSSIPHDEHQGFALSDSRWIRLSVFVVSVILISSCAVITLVCLFSIKIFF